ncbi:hypothetical protein TWF281_006618 [Arthrobotrys megalospora]
MDTPEYERIKRFLDQAGAFQRGGDGPSRPTTGTPKPRGNDEDKLLRSIPELDLVDLTSEEEPEIIELPGQPATPGGGASGSGSVQNSGFTLLRDQPPGVPYLSYYNKAFIQQRLGLDEEDFANIANVVKQALKENPRLCQKFRKTPKDSMMPKSQWRVIMTDQIRENLDQDVLRKLESNGKEAGFLIYRWAVNQGYRSDPSGLGRLSNIDRKLSLEELDDSMDEYEGDISMISTNSDNVEENTDASLGRSKSIFTTPPSGNRQVEGGLFTIFRGNSSQKVKRVSLAGSKDSNNTPLTGGGGRPAPIKRGRPPRAPNRRVNSPGPAPDIQNRDQILNFQIVSLKQGWIIIAILIAILGVVFAMLMK